MRAAGPVAIAVALAMLSAGAWSKDPDCTSPEAWPAGMALTHLKNAGMLDDRSIDATRTTVRVLASEPIGKNRFRQVHLVQFARKSGEPVAAITVNEVSREECSMSNVDVYVVASKLGDYSSPAANSTRK